MKQKIFLLFFAIFFLHNWLHAQTVSVDNSNLAATATYTFTYTTNQDIGMGTSYPTIFVLYKNNISPANYSNFNAIDTLSANDLSIKVNGSSVPLSYFSLKSSYAGGVFIRTSTLAIPSGSQIEIKLSNVITNPTISATYIFSWQITNLPGSTIQPCYSNVIIGTPSIFSTAFYTFGATPTFVTIPHSSYLNLSNALITALTLEAWVKPTDVSGAIWQHTILAKENGNNTGYVLRYGDGGRLDFTVGIGGNWQSISTNSAVLTNNVWTHVAVTYDGFQAKLYIDGIQVNNTSGSINGIMSTNTTPLTIGESFFGNRKHIGLLDEIRIYNVVKTATQIQNYRSFKLCSSSSELFGISAYYPISSSDASSLIDVVNGNNGSYSNSNLYYGLGHINSNVVDAGTMAYLTASPSTICIGDSSILSASFSPDLTNKVWTPQSSLNNMTVSSATASPSSTTTYTVTASHLGGCSVSSTTTLTVKPYYNINASASSNGSISSSGISAVCENENKTYTITPNAGYLISNVLVDGNSVGALATYTFSNVTATHTISASFVISCQTTYATLNQSICQGSSYAFNGQNLTTAGTYLDTLVNAGGCDSILTLNLTVNNITSTNTSQTACNSFTWNGMTYTTSGTYTHVGTNANGCPQNDTLILTIELPTNDTTYATSCDTYTWTSGNGQTYTNSGTYSFSTPSASAGCGSNYVLILSINPSTSSSISETACNSFTWNGMTYTSSGTYTHVGTNANGCPQNDTLVLIINNSNTGSSTATGYGLYIWNGTTYTTSGVYTGTFTNVLGCDSVHTLNLTILPSQAPSITVSNPITNALTDYTFTWVTPIAIGGGTNYPYIFYHFKNLIIPANYPNYQVINPLTANDVSIYVNGVLSPMSNFIATQSWNGGIQIFTVAITIPAGSLIEITAHNIVTNPAIAGSYNLQWRSMDGNSNVTQWFNANTIITQSCTTTYGSFNQSICQGSSYTFNGQNLTTTGTYLDTLVNADGCDSIVTLNLTINSLPTVSAVDVSGCPGSTISLSGYPIGGTFSVANPYTGPSTIYTYTYSDPTTGCSSTSASANISINSLNPVSGMSVSTILGSTVLLSWNSINGAAWYTLRYRVIGSSTWIYTSTSGNVNSKQLIGLTPNTEYEVEIRANCSTTNPGVYGANTTFTTATACPAPINLNAINVTKSTVILTWDAVLGAAWYNIRYRIVGDPTWIVGSTVPASKSLAGLTPSTQYAYQVLTKCSSIESSVWSGIENFTTLANKENSSELNEVIKNEVDIYPNPVQNQLNVDVVSENNQLTTVKIFDISGRMIKQIKAYTLKGTNNLQINLSEIASGLYTVQVYTDQKLVSTSKLNKQN